MKRRREQKGTVYKKCGMWYLRYSDVRVVDGELQRKRLAKQLGSADEMTKTKARDEAESFLRTINKPVLQPEQQSPWFNSWRRSTSRGSSNAYAHLLSALTVWSGTASSNPIAQISGFVT